MKSITEKEAEKPKSQEGIEEQLALTAAGLPTSQEITDKPNTEAGSSEKKADDSESN